MTVLLIADSLGAQASLTQDHRSGSPVLAFKSCTYGPNVTRFDLEACAAWLDETVTALRNRPNGWYLVVDGFATADEHADVARLRAWSAWFHLTENLGERPDRIFLRSKRLLNPGSGQNRPGLRFWLVAWGTPLPPLRWDEDEISAATRSGVELPVAAERAQRVWSVHVNAVARAR